MADTVSPKKSKKSIGNPDYQIFVGLLRDLRLRVELSQERLAKALGTDQTYVSDIELGKRRQDVLQIQAWAEVCGKVSLSVLMAEFEERLSDPKYKREVRKMDLRKKGAPRLQPVRSKPES